MEFIKTHKYGFGPVLEEFMKNLFLSLAAPEVAPAEPITKPDTRPQPVTRPAEDDPFNVPAPKVNPTPKGEVS